MGRLGPTELIIIAVLAFMIFGPSRLPELGRAIGKTVRELRNAAKDLGRESAEAKKVLEEPVKDAVREVHGDA